MCYIFLLYACFNRVRLVYRIEYINHTKKRMCVIAAISYSIPSSSQHSLFVIIIVRLVRSTSTCIWYTYNNKQTINKYRTGKSREKIVIRGI